MPLNLQNKQAVVAEVADIATRALVIVASENRGLTAAEMNDLRVEGRKNSVYIRIVRNTLMRRAIVGTEFECLSEHLKNSLVLAFSMEEYSAAAKLIRSFAKTHNNLTPKVIAIGGQPLPPECIDQIANLPTLDDARVKLLSVLNAPVVRLLCTLSEPAAGCVRVLQAYAEKASTEAVQ